MFPADSHFISVIIIITIIIINANIYFYVYDWSEPRLVDESLTLGTSGLWVWNLVVASEVGLDGWLLISKLGETIESRSIASAALIGVVDIGHCGSMR